MTMAMGQAIAGNPGLINEVQQVCQSTIIEEKPICNCEFINYKNIR